MYVYFLLFSFFLSPGLKNQTSESKLRHDLEVIVQNVRYGKGLVRICIFDDKKDFFCCAIQCFEVIAPENTDTVSVVFQNLEEKSYAIAVYQDFNLNGILDKNWLGLPKEPYGFSNNPSTFFGPPGFSKASFELNENKKIFVRL